MSCLSHSGPAVRTWATIALMMGPAALVTGCAHRPAACVPAALPASPAVQINTTPAHLHADLVVTVHLPHNVANTFQVPSEAKTTLKVEGEAHQTNANPMRSRWTNDVQIKVTDPQGTQTYVDLQVHASGDSKQPPEDALFDGGRQLIQMMTAAAQSQAAVASAPTSHPTSLPSTLGIIGVDVQGTVDLPNLHFDARPATKPAKLAPTP